MISTDRFFHVQDQTRGFFEGWYFKHQINAQVYAFIPGISIDAYGKKQIFVQVISQTSSHYFSFPDDALKIDESNQEIKIGNNVFSMNGLVIDLHSDELTIKGHLIYHDLHAIKRSVYAPSVMGPFSYLSFMACYHGILSMEHVVSGSLTWADAVIDFDNGKGYIEKDWGSSFPDAYVWVQCNQFSQDKMRLFFSAANIPFLGLSFLGLICVLQIGTKEYRFATYHGGKITSIVRKQEKLILQISQKRLQMTIEIATDTGHALQAPMRGEMSRIIREHACTTIRVTLTQNGQEILSEKGSLAGFEEVGNVQGFHY